MRSKEPQTLKAPLARRSAEAVASPLEDFAYGSLVGLTLLFVLITIRSLLADPIGTLRRRSAGPTHAQH